MRDTEITEEMIEAGLVVLESAYDDISVTTLRAREAVRDIYRQMRATEWAQLTAGTPEPMRRAYAAQKAMENAYSESMGRDTNEALGQLI
jgi:hypothetical protein